MARRRRQHERNEDRRAALMPWVWASFNTPKGHTPPDIEDFMPGGKDEPDPDEVEQKLDAFSSSLRGEG